MYVHTYIHTYTFRIESNACDCASGVRECRALLLTCMALLPILPMPSCRNGLLTCMALLLTCMALLLTCMALLPIPLMHSCRNGLLSERHSSDRFSYLSGHGQCAMPHPPCPFNSNPPSSIVCELFRFARQCLRSVFLFFLTDHTLRLISQLFLSVIVCPFAF